MCGRINKKIKKIEIKIITKTKSKQKTKTTIRMYVVKNKKVIKMKGEY